MKTIYKKQAEALKKVIAMNGWGKRGGHPDKSMERICTLLKEAGFRETRSTLHGTPDGYNSNHGDHFKHPLGITAELFKHYGGVAHDNSFSFSVTLPRKERKY